MKKNVYLSILLLLSAVSLACQSCKENKATIEINSLTFTVANVTPEKEITAVSGMGSVTVTTTVSINGESKTIMHKSNELPVRAGDILEVRFSPVDECPEAYFSMPDGKVLHATKDNATLKWTVPDNFTEGMEIKGENSYETPDSKIIQTGKITLVAY